MRSRALEVLRREPEYRGKAAALAAVLFAAIFGLDYLTQGELAFSLFYVLPVAILVWFLGTPVAVGGSIVGALLSLYLDLNSEAQFTHAVVPYWNALTSAALYLSTIVLLGAFKATLAREKDLARTDSLTGVANMRRFCEIAEMELMRSARYGHPFTVVYVDVDDFKELNDRFGHVTGDDVLKALARGVDDTARNSDVVARLGGDEFAILLPETSHEGAARFLVRLKTHLLAAFEVFTPLITVSVGAVTFTQVPESVEQMIRAADEVMYEVKRAGKNDVRQKLLGSALTLEKSGAARGVKT